MRPKRRILLIDSDEVRRSCTAFQLRIWGFQLATPDSQADLILAFTPVDEKWIAKSARKRGCSALLVWDGKGVVGSGFTRVIIKPNGDMLRASVLEMLVRKRGPVPKAVKAARESLYAHTHIDVGNSFQVAGCPGD